MTQRIVSTFNEEQRDAWELGAPRLVQINSVRLEKKDIDGQSFICIIPGDRLSGRTYYVASLYVIWCINNIGQWIRVEEAGTYVAENRVLCKQIEDIAAKFLASTPLWIQFVVSPYRARGMIK